MNLLSFFSRFIARYLIEYCNCLWLFRNKAFAYSAVKTSGDNFEIDGLLGLNSVSTSHGADIEDEEAESVVATPLNQEELAAYMKRRERQRRGARMGMQDVSADGYDYHREDEAPTVVVHKGGSPLQRWKSVGDNFNLPAPNRSPPPSNSSQNYGYDETAVNHDKGWNSTNRAIIPSATESEDMNPVAQDPYVDARSSLPANDGGWGAVPVVSDGEEDWESIEAHGGSSTGASFIEQHDTTKANTHLFEQDYAANEWRPQSFVPNIKSDPMQAARASAPVGKSRDAGDNNPFTFLSDDEEDLETVIPFPQRDFAASPAKQTAMNFQSAAAEPVGRLRSPETTSTGASPSNPNAMAPVENSIGERTRGGSPPTPPSELAMHEPVERRDGLACASSQNADSVGNNIYDMSTDEDVAIMGSDHNSSAVSNPFASPFLNASPPECRTTSRSQLDGRESIKNITPQRDEVTELRTEDTLPYPEEFGGYAPTAFNYFEKEPTNNIGPNAVERHVQDISLPLHDGGALTRHAGAVAFGSRLDFDSS